MLPSSTSRETRPPRIVCLPFLHSDLPCKKHFLTEASPTKPDQLSVHQIFHDKCIRCLFYDILRSNILPKLGISNFREMDEQVVQVRKDLQNQFGSQQWRLNLKAGPDCVLILAECSLLISKPEVMALDLSDPRLPYVHASRPHHSLSDDWQ
jgi:hypothetical protein